MNPEIVQSPSWDVLSLLELKRFALVTHDEQDAELASFRDTAVEWCQSYTGQTFRQTTFRESFTGFPDQLSRSPVQSVSGVEYIDPQGSWQTAHPYWYDVDLVGTPAKIDWRYMPATSGCNNNVRVVYDAGFGSGWCPEPIKAAVRILATELHENRQMSITGTIVSPVQFTVKNLLSQHRICL